MNKPYDKTKMGRIVFCLFALGAAAYLLLLYFSNQRIVAFDVSGCDTTAAERMEYKIEEIVPLYNYITITGYAYEPGVNLDTAATVVLAHDPATDTYYKLPTEVIKKVGDGCDYDYARFQSVIRRTKLPGGCNVCIWYRGNDENRLISTDKVIFY